MNSAVAAVLLALSLAGQAQVNVPEVGHKCVSGCDAQPEPTDQRSKKAAPTEQVDPQLTQKMLDTGISTLGQSLNAAGRRQDAQDAARVQQAISSLPASASQGVATPVNPKLRGAFHPADLSRQPEMRAKCLRIRWPESPRLTFDAQGALKASDADAEPALGLDDEAEAEKAARIDAAIDKGSEKAVEQAAEHQRALVRFFGRLPVNLKALHALKENVLIVTDVAEMAYELQNGRADAAAGHATTLLTSKVPFFGSGVKAVATWWIKQEIVIARGDRYQSISDKEAERQAKAWVESSCSGTGDDASFYCGVVGDDKLIVEEDCKP